MSYYKAEEISNLEEEIYNLEEEIMQLKQKLNKTKECLRFYANGRHIDSASIGSSYSIRIEDGTKAKDCLKEIEK